MIDPSFLSTSLFWGFVLCIYAYNIFLALVAVFRSPKKISRHKASKRFACMIPAHNEENVIGDLLSSLQNQNYPKDLYQVFVVADRCMDNTVKITGEKARVFNKNEGSEGKGNVIRFFLEKLFNELHEERFDAVCFFDADNTVHPNFLQRMNDGLCEGKKCIQGYLGVKNPRDKWVTKAIYASYLVANRLWQLSKETLGLSAACGGTGFCITTDLLVEYGWPAKTLTEDLEMEIIYSLKGIRFSWIHDAIVYDEKPQSLRIALRQRTRWLIGHLNVLRIYFTKLVVRGVKTRDIKLLDQALYLIFPIFWFAIGFLTFMWGLELIAHIEVFCLGATETIILDVLMLCIYPSVGICLENRSLKDLTIIPYMLAFAPIWVLALFLALFKFGERKWFHTPHGIMSREGSRRP